MDGTLDAWDILQQQKEAVLSVKVWHKFKEGKTAVNSISIQNKAEVN
jgi:hypothetical protein